MTKPLVPILLAVFLVFNGVASASAMVMPCHAMTAAEAAGTAHDQHLLHGPDEAHGESGATVNDVRIPCDGTCCEGLACPGHATVLIEPQATVWRAAWSGQSSMADIIRIAAPVLRPVIPPYRPPAY